MTVPAGTAKVQYYGSGTTGPFAFNFVLYDTSHLKVTKTSLLGVDTTLVLTTDYTVTLASDFSSATLTLVSSLAGTGIPASSEKLTITRDPPVSQLIEWARNDKFPALSHQRAADLAVMLIDRVNEKIGRSLLLPESSSISGLTLPSPLALGFLRWNAAATALENVLVFSPGALTVSPFIQTLLDDADAATARTTLGTVASSAVSSFMLTVLDDTTAAAALATLTAAGQGKQSIWLPAASFIAAGAGSPSSGTLSVGGAQAFNWAFDPTVAEFIIATLAMPKSWNGGTLSAKFYWTHPATATNFGVAWQAAFGSYGDNEAFANVYSATADLIDTGGTTNNVYISAESTAATPGGSPNGQDLMSVFVARSATNGSDTLAVDAYFLGVMFYYTTNAVTDA